MVDDKHSLKEECLELARQLVAGQAAITSAYLLGSAVTGLDALNPSCTNSRLVWDRLAG